MKEPLKSQNTVEQASEPAQLVAAVRGTPSNLDAKDKDTISTLIAVLGYNNPAAAIIAVAGLIRHGFGAAIDGMMRTQLWCRAYSIQALAAIDW